MNLLHKRTFELIDHCVPATVLIEIASLQALARGLLEFGRARLGHSLLALFLVELCIELVLLLLELLLGYQLVDLGLEGVFLVGGNFGLRQLLKFL